MLEVRDLDVNYGRIRALQGVSLDVAEGEIVALIGANGAGKSSTMNAISGVVRAAAGEIRLDGQDLVGFPAHRIVRRGVVQVPEGRLIFAGLTIEENVRLAAAAAHDRRGEGKGLERVLDLFPMLRHRLKDRGSGLSGGQAQMLALARGLVAAPRLLLLDEPSLGLAPVAAIEVFDLISKLRGGGVTVLLVEQNVRRALAIADRGYVLESGRITLEGEAKELLGHERLVRSYLGIHKREVA